MESQPYEADEENRRRLTVDQAAEWFGVTSDALYDFALDGTRALALLHQIAKAHGFRTAAQRRSLIQAELDRPLPSWLRCPRCHGPIPNSMTPGQYHGVLSRADNLTEVCHPCGTEESLLWDLAVSKLHDPTREEVIQAGLAVCHPTKGYLEWIRPPLPASSDDGGPAPGSAATDS